MPLKMYVSNVALHVVGKLTPEERTYIPESETGKVFLRARIYVLIYAAVIALAIYTRSLLPLMYIGLPNFLRGLADGDLRATPSTPGWRRTCSITA